MKPQELRIGNWVTELDHLNNRQEVQVQEIDPPHIEARGDLKPIPLTEEWLERLGFEANQNSWEKGNFDLIQFSGEAGFRDRGLTLQGLGTEIKHVHQLQNLYYALTGNELTFLPQAKEEDDIIQNQKTIGVIRSIPTDEELDDAAIQYCKKEIGDREDDYQSHVEAFDGGAIWMRQRLLGKPSKTFVG